MSKRNIEGDVLSNRLAVGQAKSQRLLAAMLGPSLKSEDADEKLQREQEREELEDESFGPEQCVWTRL
jgi:phosphoribosylaminoimidazole-succinocarboxamide synthase